MKRSWTAAAFSLLVTAGGAALYAGNSTTLTVQPSEMREGETKTVSEDGRAITVQREGNTTLVRIDGAEKTETLTITRDGDRIRIGRSGGEGPRSIVIDGLPFGEFDSRRRHESQRRWQTFFVCPKDGATLRVPRAKADGTYRCPLDGADMEKRKGHSFTFFFDDSTEL